jgi:hypothetical protein
MATITTTPISDTTSSVISQVTLDDTLDTFTLTAATGLLILENPTGGAISPIITGDGATTAFCQGVGVIDLTSGTDVFGSISAGTTKVLRAGVKKDYLKGVIDISGGTGLIASYLELG